MCVPTQNGAYRLQLATAKFVELGRAESGGGATVRGAIAPMPGVIDKVNVRPGDEVKAGDPVAVIIAMKMEVCCLWIELMYFVDSMFTAVFSGCGEYLGLHVIVTLKFGLLCVLSNLACLSVST